MQMKKKTFRLNLEKFTLKAIGLSRFKALQSKSKARASTSSSSFELRTTGFKIAGLKPNYTQFQQQTKMS